MDGPTESTRTSKLAAMAEKIPLPGFSDKIHVPSSSEKMTYPQQADKYRAVGDAELEADVRTYYSQSHHPPREYCGMRRAYFIALIVVVCIIIAAGLRAGLGVGLSKRQSPGNSPSGSLPTTTNTVAAGPTIMPVSVMRDTNMASVVRGDGNGVLLYYRAGNSSVIESYIPLRSLTIESLQASPLVASERRTLDLPDLTGSSDLSAVSFMLNGTIWRSLFYTDRSGYVKTINATGPLSSPWNQPIRIFPDPIPSTSSLTACHFDNVGLRVYFGNNGKDYWATRTNFISSPGNNTWSGGLHVEGFDAASSAVCMAVAPDGAYPAQELYGKTGIGELVAHSHELANERLGWGSLHPPLSSSIELASPTVFAGATDPQTKLRSLGYYRGQDGGIKQFRVQHGSADALSYTTFADTGLVLAGQEAKMAAVWVDNGNDAPLLFYEGREGEVHWAIVGWDARVVVNGTLGM
ncbi:Hypothetical protein D9617_6g096060 [Elsinoe fawcettii]|nr:Hypothetical protein D9617_6g096060 [Elsinoe fawcettii]